MSKNQAFNVTDVSLETWVVVDGKRTLVRSEDWSQSVTDAIADGWQPQSIHDIIDYVRDER